MALFHTTVLDNQIKALPTVGTASGAIATFNTDLTENLVDVKCQIVAKQASGTPTPDNPLPITTYTEMNVVATGKNLLPNVKWQVNTNRVEIGRDNVYDTIHLKSGTYTIKVDCDIVATIYYLNNGSTVSLGNTTEARTLTLSEDIDTIFWVYKSGGVSVNDVHNYQLEIGNEPTAYEPFGTTANIPFGQTVANGVIDVTTGKLNFEQTAKSYDGSENWELQTTGDTTIVFRLLNAVSSIANQSNQLCNLARYNSQAYSANDLRLDTFVMGTSKTLYVQVSKTDFPDVATFKTFLGNENLTVVYNIAPTEIQLDSITLQALLNENNIWCDTGDTEVKFLLTVGKKIS